MANYIQRTIITCVAISAAHCVDTETTKNRDKGAFSKSPTLNFQDNSNPKMESPLGTDLKAEINNQGVAIINDSLRIDANYQAARADQEESNATALQEMLQQVLQYQGQGAPQVSQPILRLMASETIYNRIPKNLPCEGGNASYRGLDCYSEKIQADIDRLLITDELGNKSLPENPRTKQQIIDLNYYLYLAREEIAQIDNSRLKKFLRENERHHLNANESKMNNLNQAEEARQLAMQLCQSQTSPSSTTSNVNPLLLGLQFMCESTSKFAIDIITGKETALEKMKQVSEAMNDLKKVCELIERSSDERADGGLNNCAMKILTEAAMPLDYLCALSGDKTRVDITGSTLNCEQRALGSVVNTVLFYRSILKLTGILAKMKATLKTTSKLAP